MIETTPRGSMWANGSVIATPIDVADNKLTRMSVRIDRTGYRWNYSVIKGGIIPAKSGCSRSRRLFSTQRNDDLLIAAGECDFAVLNCFDGDLVGLSAGLQSELLPFTHDLAVDDGKASSAFHRDRRDNKCGNGNVGAATVGAGIGQFRHWFPTDRPEWVARLRIESKGRFVFDLKSGRVGGIGLRQRHED